jgi:hypothetical protein
VLSGGLVRNPLSSATTFPGDALTLDKGSIQRFKPPSPGVATTVDFPGVTGSGGIRVAPASPMLNISANGPSLSIPFSTEQGHSYALQTKLDLLGAKPWSPVGSPMPGDGTVKSVLTSAASAQGFYRLLVQ